MKISQNDRIQAKRVINRFKKHKSERALFYDLCFAICAPQTTFKSNLKVNETLMKLDFYHNSLNKTILEEAVKPARFYRNKSKWLIEAKNKFNNIEATLDLYGKIDNGISIRNWLVDHIKGLGMKASSHFLRNQGYDNLAVIDTHIIKFLSEYLNWDEVNISTKMEYLYWENEFRQIARKHKLTVAELDAIIWKQRSNTDWKDFIY